MPISVLCIKNPFTSPAVFFFFFNLLFVCYFFLLSWKIVSKLMHVFFSISFFIHIHLSMFTLTVCACYPFTHTFLCWSRVFFLLSINKCRNMESFNMNVSCKLHGSPKTQATNTISPVHRLHSLDLMDDIPLTFCKETNTNSPILTTPIIEHNKVMTPRRQVNHQLHALNDDLSSNTTNHKNKSYGGGGGGGSGGGCGFGGNSSVCGSVNGINVLGNSAAYNPDGMLGTSSNSTTVHHQNQSTSASHSQYKSLHRSFSQQEPTKDDRCGLRHRWQACPELHKAMDGVNYIADHTRKEEESTKVTHKNPTTL